MALRIDGGTACDLAAARSKHNDIGVYVHGGGSVTLTGNTITLNGIGVEVGSTGTLTAAHGQPHRQQFGQRNPPYRFRTTSVGAITNNEPLGQQRIRGR